MAAISSVGIGSGILTQDVLDQLRAADEAGRIRPIDLAIVNETDRQDAFNILDAGMTNFIDKINEIKNATLWDERAATVTSGTSVSATAIAKTDIQDFTIDVTALAIKQIEQSGQFGADTDLIATAAGSLNLNINGQDFTVNYDETMTLKDLKNAINNVAGTEVDATIINIASGDTRIVISSANTGSNQDITITDTDGFLSDDGGTTAGGTKLTTDFTNLQTGGDATFTFNGQSITRTTNEVSDLITGLTLNLEETGVSEVSIAQDRTSILTSFDSFVTNYNDNMKELNRLTKISTASADRGIFSSDSMIKGLKRTIQDMLEGIGGGVGSMVDYGFEVDKDGVLSLDKTVLEAKMDTEPLNTQSFFSGGDYTKADGSVVVLTGAFAEMSTIVEAYTNTNTLLDNFNTSITQKLSNLNDRKLSATESLDVKYEILKKRYAAFDAIINGLNATSNIFAQLANQSNN
ncbi:flagellar filament capping protein FliD [Sulfurimonas sp. SAG-AH-194-C21]|nr:flagellar filament capping protein FliD [Sulfurimonas sp. SAG-AH-194-C21]MDF1883749.1 flagellar filament capping protein FliD [Sulfurimonas sp. SAG-AH-194-C21]